MAASLKYINNLHQGCSTVPESCVFGMSPAVSPQPAVPADSAVVAAAAADQDCHVSTNMMNRLVVKQKL